MLASRCCRLLLAAVCTALLAASVQATRPGPMLRGGTVVLISGPRSGLFLPRGFPSGALELEGSDAFDVGTLERVLQEGPSVFGPPLRMFGRPEGLLEPFGVVPRRPCRFARQQAQGPDAMVKRMAAARFGPDLLSSLLAVAEAEEQQAEEQEAELDAPIYTIKPAAQVAATEPRRLAASGGVDFHKDGPFRGRVDARPDPGFQHPLSSRPEGLLQRLARGAGGRSGIASVSTGFGVSEAGAARLTAGDRAQLQAKHGVAIAVDRMQLGGSRSFPMVTISSVGGGGAVDAAAEEVHAITDDATSTPHLTAAHQGARILPAKAADFGGPGWSFHDFVSRVGQRGSQAAVGDTQEAQRHAAFEGRIFGDRAASAPLQSAHVAPPAMSWDLFQDDGQLNAGELVFLLLCIACAAVWSRLAVLWCTYRRCSGDGAGRRCRRRGRRFGCHAAKVAAAAEDDGLEAPLLNPLHQEAPTIPNTVPFKVEVAARHTPEAPSNNYVSLVYVPLKGEL